MADRQKIQLLTQPDQQSRKLIVFALGLGIVLLTGYDTPGYFVMGMGVGIFLGQLAHYFSNKTIISATDGDVSFYETTYGRKKKRQKP